MHVSLFLYLAVGYHRCQNATNNEPKLNNKRPFRTCSDVKLSMVTICS